MIINSDYPAYSGALFTFNEDVILKIEGNDNDTLKKSSLVVNFYKKIPLVPEESKQIEDKKLLYVLIVVGCGAVVLISIVVCCVLRRAASKKRSQFEGRFV